VHRQVISEPLRRRAAPARMEFQRLRAGVFRLGASAGLDTREVVRFSEAISGRRWRRCGCVDLERVVADLRQLIDHREARLMLHMRITRSRSATREPARHMLELVTPRTNAALISPAEHLCGGLSLRTAATGGGPVALEIAADGERCGFLLRTQSELELRRLRGQGGAAYPQAELRPLDWTTPQPVIPCSLDPARSSAVCHGTARR